MLAFLAHRWAPYTSLPFAPRPQRSIGGVPIGNHDWWTNGINIAFSRLVHYSM